MRAHRKPGAAKPATDSTKVNVRTAAANLGLPKGSFFVDETKMVAGEKPKDPKKKEVSRPTRSA